MPSRSARKTGDGRSETRDSHGSDYVQYYHLGYDPVYSGKVKDV
jgi:hypothetical protein